MKKQLIKGEIQEALEEVKRGETYSIGEVAKEFGIGLEGGRWESNPLQQRHKLLRYHYATTAMLFSSGYLIFHSITLFKFFGLLHPINFSYLLNEAVPYKEILPYIPFI